MKTLNQRCNADRRAETQPAKIEHLSLFRALGGTIEAEDPRRESAAQARQPEIRGPRPQVWPLWA